MPNEQPLENTAPRESFLVTREDGSWREVFRLSVGQVITVGRDSDNRIIVRDDRCSRRHCDLYATDEQWHVRDLKSRNGTAVNGVKITHDHPLFEGDVVRIGACEMLFTADISRPLDRSIGDPRTSVETDDIELGHEEPAGPQILRRTSQARYVTESGLSADSGRVGAVREEISQLLHLVLQMVAAQDVQSLAGMVLDGLLSNTEADIGAVLVFPESEPDASHPDQLRIISYGAPDGTPYHKVSNRLSQVALQEGEAILARDLSVAAGTTEFQTLADIHAESVICAPIRRPGSILGLLHLYSLRIERSLDVDDLEFTLAVADELALMLEGLRQKESLTDGLNRARDQNQTLARMLEIESDLVGDSAEMQRLRDTIARIAAADAVTLVRGESGVGKELVARAVHFNSGRRDGPFICLNCAALTESLLESELFGHEKGSFTGATDRKIGKFERADGGTLFLDEVGEMPQAIQAKFLRVLEGQAFERVGGHNDIRADVRVVAATNRDLEEAVQQGTFRKDLFFRLHILEILVPPLREHPSDIPVLAEFFLERSCRRAGRPSLCFTPKSMAKLRSYEWPGNVRELRNVVERAVVLADAQEIPPESICFSSTSPPSAWLNQDLAWGYEAMSLEEVERIHITRTMQWTEWKKREAARILGINRSTLDRKLERYQIQPPADQ